jgi:hypothetical protein
MPTKPLLPNFPVALFFGGRLALQEQMPVADLVACFMYLDMLYAPLHFLSRV